MSTEKKKGGFVQKLDKEELAFFNSVVAQPFAQQGIAFLNAYWPKIGNQADYIFNVAYETFRETDMHYKGVQYVHLYEEGVRLEFNAALNMYERLCKKWDDEKNNKYLGDEVFDKSKPVMMTSLKRKKELKDKVDVNFDNHVSFMEYLLYQYKVPPNELVQTLMTAGDEPQEVIDARQALAEVTEAINALEKKRAKLEKQAAGSGVKALAAKNQLAQMDSSPEAEKLTAMLITAEAKVRAVIKKYGGKTVDSSKGSYNIDSAKGARWWLKADLDQKKRKYGKKKK